MNYNETIAYIHNTPKLSRHLGNDMLKKLLHFYGNPQNELKFIHIAGTNGKGSTACMLAEILQEAGYRTGLFTSPYLMRFNERIRINGTEIPDNELARITTELRINIEKNNAPVSEFALNTAIALLWFREQKTDIVVWETGLGGRLDATNVIPDKEVAVLTRIGLDHTQYLGNTLTEITAEKCGILTENGVVISYPDQEEEAASAIIREAKEKNNRVVFAVLPQRTDDGMIYRGTSYKIGLPGEYQRMNAATALETVFALREKGYSISEKAIQTGLLHAKNQGRYQWIRENILIDGAHNPQAIQALCDSLAQERKKIIFCVAMMEDKDYKEALTILSKYSDTIILTQLNMPRCCMVSELKQIAKPLFSNIYSFDNPVDALRMAENKARQNNTVCICGSLYFVGFASDSLHNNIM